MSTRVSTSSGFQTPPPRLAEGGEALDLALTTAGGGWWHWREAGNHLQSGADIARLRGTAPTSLPQLLAQVHRDDRHAVQEAIVSARPQPRRIEYRLTQLDGSVRWVLGCIRTVRDDDGDAVLGIEIDIDAQKRNQSEMKASIDVAAKATEDKEKFVYICSHDLREPLRMISGFLGLLERRASGLDQRGRDYLALAVDGAGRLNSMLDDLLTYSRCGRARSPAPTPVERALAAARADLEPDLAASAAAVTAGELPVITADPEQLQRLLRELLSNAMKFRRERGPRIAVRAERGERSWILSVSDDGIGIPADDRQRVFEAFHRLHLRDAYPGNGIGLALCAKIAQQHGGRIWIEAPADGAPGTIVKVSFPD